MSKPDLHSLNAYDYHLPERSIAQSPVEPRDHSRLLVVYREEGRWEHHHFYDLPGFLNTGDLLVANNTKVIKARLVGKRIRIENGQKIVGGHVEFLLLQRMGARSWEGAFHASAKHKPGVEFEVPAPPPVHKIHGKIIRGASDSSHGTIVVEFDHDPVQVGAGEIPLPHYIERSPDASDQSRYQTVYAKKEGSAAAPTAGLHFTPKVLDSLKHRNVAWTEVTLQVGLGTFRPVKVEDIRQHSMHEEQYEVEESVALQINQAKAAKSKIVAVGTTSLRTLESATLHGRVQAGPGKTSLFVYPGGYEFKTVDRLITNFHLPKSTLLMLVCAFGGHDLIMAAYRDAVQKEYRFFSYGDAMLIL